MNTEQTNKQNMIPGIIALIVVILISALAGFSCGSYNQEKTKSNRLECELESTRKVLRDIQEQNRKLAQEIKSAHIIQGKDIQDIKVKLQQIEGQVSIIKLRCGNPPYDDKLPCKPKCNKKSNCCPNQKATEKYKSLSECPHPFLPPYLKNPNAPNKPKCKSNKKCPQNTKSPCQIPINLGKTC